MRKSMTTLLAVGLMLAAGGQVAKAAGAGVGLEWSIGPAISLSGFDMKMGQQFTLDWRVSDSFSVGVWNSSAIYRGEKTYTNATTTTLKHKLVATGSVAANGITLLTTLPGLSFLELGINVGVETLTADAGSPVPSRSDNTAATLAGDWGGASALTVTAPLLGVGARLSLLKAETKTVTTIIGINAGLNFVQFKDINALGTLESQGTLPAKTIDPVSSYSTLGVMLNAAIWF